MKCQVINAQPAAGGNMKVIGAAHPDTRISGNSFDGRLDSASSNEVRARVQGRVYWFEKTTGPPQSAIGGIYVVRSSRSPHRRPEALLIAQTGNV